MGNDADGDLQQHHHDRDRDHRARSPLCPREIVPEIVRVPVVGLIRSVHSLILHPFRRRDGKDSPDAVIAAHNF